MLNNDNKFSVMFNHYLWLIPFCISILFFSLNGIHTLPDSAWYLSNGLNIYKGLGYVNPDLTPVLNRGPVFPVLIAGSFYLFGVKIESAFWVVRTFYIFNALLIYFVGFKLYGKWTGLVASLLVLTSHIINIWSSYILVDIVMPCFILLYILLLYCAFEKQRYSLFILAGISGALAFLTKEMAILYLPLPFLISIIIRQYRNMANLRGLIISVATFFAVISPWIIHIYNNDGASSFLIGNAGPKALESLSEHSSSGEGFGVINLTNQYIQAVKIYFYKYIVPFFVFYPIILLSYLFILIGVVRRKKEDLFLFLTLLIFVSVILYILKWELRPGQSIIFYFLTYIAVAHFLVATGQYIYRISATLKKVSNFLHHAVKYILILAIGGIVVFQALGDKNMLGLIKGKSIVGFNYFSKDKYPNSGWHNDEVRKVGEWLCQNIQSDANIMCDYFWFLSLYFYTDADYRIYEIPYRVYPRELVPRRQAGVETTDLTRKPLFLWPHLNKPHLKNYLRVLCEDDLLKTIQNKKIDYVVVTAMRSFLSVYFNENPGFIKVKDTGIVKVFKVLEPQSIDSFQLQLGSNTATFLQTLELQDVHGYNNIVSNFLKGQLGLTTENIYKIKKGNGKFVYVNKIY